MFKLKSSCNYFKYEGSELDELEMKRTYGRLVDTKTSISTESEIVFTRFMTNGTKISPFRTKVFNFELIQFKGCQNITDQTRKLPPTNVRLK